MIYFTSDTHYHHKNIVRGTTEWVSENLGKKVRDFDTVQAMNDQMVENFNRLVKPDDVLYHLGDWSFGGFDKIKEFRSRLNCQNIHLIYGNHDHHIERNKDGVQGLFKSVDYYKEIITDFGTKIVLSHYSHQIWNHSHRGAFHLFGHSHNSLPGIGRSMDVGVDAAFALYNDYRPFTLQEIKENLSKIPIKLIDHHNKETSY